MKGDPRSAYAGLFLEYRVKIPILGWTPWLTEIKYVEEGYSFVDEQGGPLQVVVAQALSRGGQGWDKDDR